MRCGNRWTWIVVAVASVACGLPGGAQAKESPVTASVQAPPVTCSLVSYDGAANRLTVRFTGIPAKRPAFVAAALPKDDGTVWVQAGQQVKADGEVALEAYEFAGKARVYRARTPAGKTFLVQAQRASARQAPVSAKALARAAVEVACEVHIR